MRTKKEYIWLYNTEFKDKWLRVEKGSPKVDLDYIHCPTGMVRFQKTPKKWFYAHWGTTREECAAKANEYVDREIAELEKKIEGLKARRVVP